MPHSRPRAGLVLLSMAALAGSALLGACGGSKPEIKSVAPVVREIPEPLRGTIGAEATIRGVEPQLVSGLGLVVGLNGTGGGELPPQIQATMERELARGGIGKGGPLDVGPLAGMTPRQVLRDPNVAVVIVEAAVSPGAPAGMTFDVRVRALPGSSVTSLEGGILWTTPLTLGPVRPFGGHATRRIAEAHGPIFINPFVEPGAASSGDTVNRTVGRILGGGRIVEPLELLLVLDNPSHTRAAAMTSAINYRFPPGPGDEGPTARGRDGGSIRVRVPKAYTDNIGDFLELVRCLRIDQSFPQEHARRYVEALKTYPGLADDLSWCLEAIGKPAVPFLSSMYDYPELAPRLAALRAGAKLGDMRAVPHLVDLARTAPASIRADAITLLGGMPTNPQINFALRELVDSDELEVRVAAYEALRERADPVLRSIPIGPVAQPNFILDLVPSKNPLIYVSQEREPRIVLFGPFDAKRPATAGRGLAMPLRRPSLVVTWSDRLMIAADEEPEGSPTAEKVRIYYRDHRGGKAITQAVPDDLVRLIEFLGHKPTPEDPAPGLGLTYSQVVGALYAIQQQGAVAATCAPGSDRLMARLLRAASETALADRPESSDEPGDPIVFRPDAPNEVGPGAGTQGTGEKPSMVVPLNTPSGAAEQPRRRGGAGSPGDRPESTEGDDQRER